MIKYIVAFTILGPMTACAKSEGCIELSESFSLWVVSSEEKYVTDNNDGYLLGPKVFYIEVMNGVVVGKNTESTYGNFKNEPGHFILIDSGRMEVGMSEEEFAGRAAQLGLGNVELTRGPSDLLNSGAFPRCNQ